MGAHRLRQLRNRVKNISSDTDFYTLVSDSVVWVGHLRREMEKSGGTHLEHLNKLKDIHEAQVEKPLVLKEMELWPSTKRTEMLKSELGMD